jgi:hypothetical protein
MYSGISKQPYFRVFPPLEGVEIKCVFPASLVEAAADAVERNATIEGELRFYEGDLWPHEVKVRTIRVHPRDSDLPTLSGLIGAAPEATGELSAADFVRSLRRGWDRAGDGAEG